MNRTAAHTLLVQQIRLALGSEPDVVLWTNDIGRAFTATGRTVPYGLCVGSADLIGIGPGGRFVAFEVKTGGAVLSADQRQWQELARRLGAAVFVVRSVDEARAALTRARAEAGGAVRGGTAA